MVGRLEAGGRIAAAALLALGSLAPLNGPLLADFRRPGGRHEHSPAP